MKRTLVALFLAVSVHAAAEAKAPASSVSSSRIERHREIAETRVREHQAMTKAHMEGRAPVCPAADNYAPGATFFTPAFGDHPALTSTDGADHIALNELRMYWQRIPDFGIKRYEIYPSETGWAQVLYWSGTTTEGKLVEIQEADIFRTDENFRLVRVENYHDWEQWRTLAAFAAGKPVATFDKAAYGQAIFSQAKSPDEVCRPK